MLSIRFGNWLFQALINISHCEQTSNEKRLIWASSWEKLILLHMNNKAADQPLHQCILVSAFEPRHDISPTMWYVRPAKAQISLRIQPLLVAWIFCDCLAIDWTPFGVSKLKKGLHRLVWIYTCQNATLLEITCRGSFVIRSLASLCSSASWFVPYLGADTKARFSCDIIKIFYWIRLAFMH